MVELYRSFGASEATIFSKRGSPRSGSHSWIEFEIAVSRTPTGFCARLLIVRVPILSRPPAQQILPYFGKRAALSGSLEEAALYLFKDCERLRFITQRGICFD